MGTEKQEYLIRLMQEQDIKGVAAVEQDAFSSPWPASFFVEELANPLAKYLVMEYDEALVGYAGFWLVLGEAQVTNIALLARVRGRGLGRKLVTELIETAAADGAENISLEVRRSNLLAQELYKSLGFNIEGARPGYYLDNGEDALMMQKNLEEEHE